MSRETPKGCHKFDENKNQQMEKLKNALKINAIFSSTSGLILIILQKTIAHLFGTDNNTVFLIIGLTLIYFAITIWYEIKKQRKIAVLWIIIQDFIWVFTSIILLIFNPYNITFIGNIIVGIIAVIVLLMGINQLNKLINTNNDISNS